MIQDPPSAWTQTSRSNLRSKTLHHPLLYSPHRFAHIAFLDIAGELIDSVTNFGYRLAKHRGGGTLKVRDLQLHLGAWLIPPLYQAS